MIKSLKIAMLAAGLAGLSLTAYAAGTPSVELGKKLFNDLALGGATGAKTCASCHPNGKGVENAWKNPNLAKQINTCIVGALKGKPLPLESVEMKSLVLYHQSLKPVTSR